MTTNSASALTRRDFLKRATVAGIAPLLLPAALRAAPTSPGSQVALGFIGVGIQGRGLLGGCLNHHDVRVVAVCDVDTTRRNSAKEMVEKHYGDAMSKGTYKGCATFTDFRELVARADIDGVVIATPDHWHALTSIAALQAGKDVYCEKPLSHTVLEGRAMAKATRQHRRIFQVGSMQRSMSEFRNACELIRNGVIGTIKSVDVCVSGPPVPCDLPAEPEEPGLDWSFWLGGAPLRPYNSTLCPRGIYNFFPAWRNYREYGSGGVGDWGAHHFDIAQWALGFDDSGPVEFLPAADAKAASGVRFRYANGVEVVHQPGNGITFYGSAGKIYVNRGEFKMWLGDKLLTEGGMPASRESKQILDAHLPPNAVRLYHSDDHLTDWIKSMHTRQAPICDVEIGHRTATICELVNLTYRYHQKLSWDPAKETFVNGEGDPAWLGQEYRKPWHLA
jgi:predicted dehydrogenase